MESPAQSHKRQRKLALGPAHGTRVLLELQHPFPQAHVAAPVHARVDAEPSDRAVRKVVGVQIDRADCLPPRRQVAGLNQHAYNAEQRTPNQVHLAEGRRHNVTVPATQWTEVRCENFVFHPLRVALCCTHHAQHADQLAGAASATTSVTAACGDAVVARRSSRANARR